VSLLAPGPSVEARSCFRWSLAAEAFRARAQALQCGERQDDRQAGDLQSSEDDEALRH
jgi:hypothetical protein